MNAQYSPMLNPIEFLFQTQKRELKKLGPQPTKLDVVDKLKQVTHNVDTENKVPGMWRQAIKNWVTHLDHD